MATFTSFSVNDGETTPVAHTFEPDLNGPLPRGQVVTYINRNASNPAGSELLTLQILKSASKPADYLVPGRAGISPRRVTGKLDMPVLYTDSVSGVELVDYVLSCRVEFFIPPRATEQQVKNLRTLMRNGLAATQVALVVDRGESMN